MRIHETCLHGTKIKINYKLLKKKRETSLKSRNNTDMENRLAVTRGQGVGWGGTNKVRLKL